MRPPDSLILEAVRKRMLSSGENPPTNAQLLKENIYGGPAVPQKIPDQPPLGQDSGIGFMGQLGGGSGGPDPRQFKISQGLNQLQSGV